MILHPQLNQETSDILDISGSVLKINGTEYDLKKTTALAEGETSGVKRVYLDSNSSTVIYLKVDFEHASDFQGKNYELFFDTDMNGDISLEELTAYVAHYNLTEAERVANRKKIRAGYTDEEWKARLEKLGIAG